MVRIYHRFEKWECYKKGFFEPCSGAEKDAKSKKVVELFSDQVLTEEMMRRVVTEWRFSSQHNLTNESLNRVAWLGQSACCIYARVPFKVTMEAWHLVSKEDQDRSNAIAEKVINEYVSTPENFQLCLSFI